MYLPGLYAGSLVTLQAPRGAVLSPSQTAPMFHCCRYSDPMFHWGRHRRWHRRGSGCRGGRVRLMGTEGGSLHGLSEGAG